MADGSIKIDTKLLTDEFKKDFGLIKKSLATLTASATAFGVASINTGRKFERAMSQVGATMGLTVEEIKSGTGAFAELSKAAREAGANTEWSASEAAEALNYMALAGYDAQKSIKTLPTVLNLASAGALDLARASDMITDAMSALNLETDRVGDFADVLVKTSQKSNTSVGQLGEAILNVGGTARILKGGVIELSSALGVLANNGIKGAEGGTALRNIINQLTAPTSMASKEMERLGISVFDASGNMRSLQDIFSDFNEVLGGLTAQEKQEALSKIFHVRDLKSANALMKSVNGELLTLQDNLAMAGGTTNETAKVMKDNLTGALKNLRSKFEELSNTLYEKIGPVLKTITDKFSDFLTSFTKSDSMKEFGVAIAQLFDSLRVMAESILPILVKGFSMFNIALQWIVQHGPEVIGAYVGLKGALLGIGIASTIAKAGINGIKVALIQTGLGALVVALGYAVGYVIDNFKELTIRAQIAWEWLKKYTVGLFKGTEEYDKKLTDLRKQLKELGDDTKKNEFVIDGEKINEEYNRAVQGMASFNEEQEETQEEIKETSKLSKAFEDSLKGMANSLDDAYASSFQNLLDGFEDVGEALANGENAFKALAKSAVMSIGEVVSAMGNQLVAQGILDSFSNIPAQKAKSTGAIAQGIALKVLAGVIKANAGKFANGGIVGGSSYSGDKLTANVNSGELILNMAQQDNIAKMLMSKANAQPLVNIQVINNTNSQVGIQQDELNNIKILIDTEINQYMTGSKGEKMLSSNYGIRKVGIR